MRIRRFLPAALALLSACSIEPLPSADVLIGAETMTFEASLDDSRTVRSGLNILWSSGDRIVVNGQASTGMTLSANRRSATFTLPLVSPPYYALYPASAYNEGTFDPSAGKYGHLVLPAEQSYVAGSFDPAAALMCGKATSAEEGLAFRCGVAFLKFTVQSGGTTARIKRIEVSAIGKEDVRGTVIYSPGKGRLIKNGTSGNAVTLSSAAGIPFGSPAYIAIVAREYASGLQVRIVDMNDDYQEIRSEKAFTAEPGTVYTTGVTFRPDKSYAPLRMDWTPTGAAVANGGYGRVHRLSDGRLILTYSNGGSDYIRFSSDDGASWTAGKLVQSKFTYGGTEIRCANPEIAQLSADNPYHPGRIIFAVNLRPGDSTIHPYSIACFTSDDNGKTWSGLQTVYASQTWETNVGKGAWEPFVHELPNGRVQIYFTDNTPYYAQGYAKGNNISVVESADGGDNWGNARIVCHTEKTPLTSWRDMGWDGMASVTRVGDELYLSVEHKEWVGDDYAMNIQLMHCSVSNDWYPTIGKGSSQRFYPFTPDEGTYQGAPYLIHTDNYLVLSYQSGAGSEDPMTQTGCTPEVVACRLDDDYTTMRGLSRPLAETFSQTAGAGSWNSLCDLGNDRICLVTEYDGKIYLSFGQIKGL